MLIYIVIYEAAKWLKQDELYSVNWLLADLKLISSLVHPSKNNFTEISNKRKNENIDEFNRKNDVWNV